MPSDKQTLLEKAREVLEWPELTAKLAERATSALGAQACRAIAPAATLKAVQRSLKETSEMADMLRDEGAAPMGSFEDIRPVLDRAEKGGAPEPVELAVVASMLELTRLVRGFFKNQAKECPLLWERASALDELKDLKREIEGSIDQSGKLRENASPELNRLTRAVRDRRASLHARFEEFMRAEEVAPILQDEFFTQRGSRYVVPVKSEFRSKLEGIVHDSSNSGQTLFIEPRQFINANNELKMAEMDVEQEARRILRELGEKVGAASTFLRTNLEILTELDVIYAKGRFALDIGANEPEVNDRGKIELLAARHPLLALSGDVVPNDIQLSGDLSALVISGPNTGGKTVTLKMLGLFALMTRAGLHLPAKSGSAMALFPEVYADIGDEQNIGRHLSTFSGHIMNIKGILEAASQGSLVMLDELVTSTDPSEGSALAEAILNRLAELGAKTIATTHYSQLKAYAQAHANFANASVEFDSKTLTPTYRLIMGVPGRSSALEIAQRLGMEQAVITRASELLGVADRRIEELLAGLEKQKQELLAETREAEQQRETARSLAEEHEKIRAELKERERQFRSTLRTRLQSEIDSARKKIQAALQALSKDRTRRQAVEAQRKLREVQDGLREGTVIEGEKVAPDQLKAGDTVIIAHLGVSGVLMEDVTEPATHGGAPLTRQKVKVRIGRVPMVVPTDSLRVDSTSTLLTVSGPVAAPESPTRKTTSEQADVDFPGTRLDLRGFRADDAVDEVQRFLDRAALAQIPEVEIIHGHGTGALKKVIRDFLKTSAYVEKWRPAELKQGGDGVTVVQMRL